MTNGVITIQSTKEYAKFQFIPGNRKINRDHLRLLKRSIEKKNLLKYNPILINKEWGIIDGQHRFMVAQELDVPMFYIKAVDVDFSDIILLNNTNRRWSLQDYLETFIEQGLKDYKILKSFASINHFSLSNSLAILGNIGSGNTEMKAPLTDYKIGEFKVADIEEAEKFAKNFKEIEIFAEENTATDRDFLRAIYRMYNKFGIEPEEFLKQMKRYPHPLFRRLTLKDYLRQFEDVYNFNRTKPVRFI